VEDINKVTPNTKRDKVKTLLLSNISKMLIQLRHRLSGEMIDKEYESITHEDLIDYQVLGVLHQAKFIEMGIKSKLSHKEIKKLIKSTL